MPRQMCMCENEVCPFHQGKQCDNPAMAKIRWHGFLTGMCKQCLDAAIADDPMGVQILAPITAAARLFADLPVYKIVKNRDFFGYNQDEVSHELPGWRIEGTDHNGSPIVFRGVFQTPEDAVKEIERRFPDPKDIEMPRTAKLLRVAQGTGNRTFDRVWDDFHAKAADPKNGDRSFHDMFEEEPAKHQILIALGKLNYMLENGGFERWIEEGYAFETGDLLLRRLPAHTHAYPVLSKLHDFLEEVLASYAEFGVENYKDLERLLTGRHRNHGMRWAGPSRDTLWGWFKARFHDKFRFRAGVTQPEDLESITGKWGDIRLDAEPLNRDLLDKYAADLAETEEQIESFPADLTKRQHQDREELMQYQADLDAVIEAIDYRLDLQKEWEHFVQGGWAQDAETQLDDLTGEYYEVVKMPELVRESAELFDATPDEVEAVEHEGEAEVEHAEVETGEE